MPTSGFDKVDLDLATEATLLLLLIAGVQAAREMRLLWTCDAVALDRAHRAGVLAVEGSHWRGKRCARALLGLVAYPCAVPDPVYTSWKTRGANF